MGMSIEQAKAMLKSYLHGSTGYTGSLRDAIDTILPIVEKYQKIEQIIRNYDVTWEFHHMKPIIDEIKEVLENGKNY